MKRARRPSLSQAPGPASAAKRPRTTTPPAAASERKHTPAAASERKHTPAAASERKHSPVRASDISAGVVDALAKRARELEQIETLLRQQLREAHVLVTSLRADLALCNEESNQLRDEMFAMSPAFPSLSLTDDPEYIA
jgi:hypothetical protein